MPPHQPRPTIVWFRDDLRLSDHPALTAAIESGAPVLAVYVFDDTSPGIRPLGGASRWWLHHSLNALSGSLARIGGRLDILKGPATPLVADLAKAAGCASVGWTRRYSAAEIAVAACPAPNVSYSLSVRLRKPDNPLSCRKDSISEFRPVSSLCG